MRMWNARDFVPLLLHSVEPCPTCTWPAALAGAVVDYAPASPHTPPPPPTTCPALPLHTQDRQHCGTYCSVRAQHSHIMMVGAPAEQAAYCTHSCRADCPHLLQARSNTPPQSVRAAV